MKNLRTVIVDVETTGLSVQSGGRVIEIGVVMVEQERIVDEMVSLINTGALISNGAYCVHGISQQMLAGQPRPEDVWPRFGKIAGNAYLVAHNAPFDKIFIRHEMNLCGLSLPNSWHCTVRLARSKLPHLPNHRLDTVYRHLFGSIAEGTQRHRALDDARMAALIWMELIK